MKETYLIIFQILVFITYLTFICKKYGIQISFSDSFYRLEETYGKSSLKQWILFWGFLACIAIPIFPLMGYSGWAFFSMAGINLVGAAARFKQRGVEKPHVIGATSGILLAFIAVGMYGSLILSWHWAWAFIIAQVVTMLILKKIKVNNYTWWIEFSAVVYIIIAEIILTLLKYGII